MSNTICKTNIPILYSKGDVIFKITIRSKLNMINSKSNGDFRNHITFGEIGVLHVVLLIT
jgi:hypothetical protein